jgi:integrase
MKSAWKVVRKRLADGSVREYRYPRHQPPKAPRVAPDSLDALLMAYRQSPEYADLKPTSRAMYAIYLRVLDKAGDTPVSAIRRRDLLALRDAIATTRGRGAATGFVRTASALLTWALDHDWIETHPLAKVRALRGGHLPAWSEAQVAVALAGLPEALRRVVVLGMHTGQRRGDLTAMGWKAYDGATIRLRQTKTGAALVLPVHPELRAELEAWKADRASTLILTSPRGKPWIPVYLSRKMGEALAGLGLPGLNVHGLRKLAATRLAEAGCSAHEIAAVTGHASLSMVQHYTRSADQERLARAAVTRLETARRKLRENGT